MAKTPSESSTAQGLKIPVELASEQRVRSERPENKPHALTPVTGVLSNCAELPSSNRPEGSVAQSVEQAIENCRVGGSTPSRATVRTTFDSRGNAMHVVADGHARRVWTHGCDACDADAPVVYVPVVGYLCAFCRRPESLDDLRRRLRCGGGL